MSLLLLAALVPRAHASPPNPVWIAGIYDDANFDEVVAAMGAVEPDQLTEGRSTGPLRGHAPGDAGPPDAPPSNVPGAPPACVEATSAVPPSHDG